MRFDTSGVAYAQRGPALTGADGPLARALPAFTRQATRRRPASRQPEHLNRPLCLDVGRCAGWRRGLTRLSIASFSAIRATDPRCHLNCQRPFGPTSIGLPPVAGKRSGSWAPLWRPGRTPRTHTTEKPPTRSGWRVFCNDIAISAECESVRSILPHAVSKVLPRYRADALSRLLRRFLMCAMRAMRGAFHILI